MEEMLFLVEYIDNTCSIHKYLTIRISSDLKYENEIQIKLNQILSSVFSKLSYPQLTITTIMNITQKDLEDGLYNSNYNYRILSKGLKRFVYYDKYFNSWNIREYQESNFDILNILYKKDIKLFLLGDTQKELLSNKTKMKMIENRFSTIFNIDSINTLLYNTKTNNKLNINGINDMLSIFMDDEGKLSNQYRFHTFFIFLFDESVDIFTIRRFMDRFRSYSNFYTFLISDSNLFTVTLDGNDIIIKDK